MPGTGYILIAPCVLYCTLRVACASSRFTFHVSRGKLLLCERAGLAHVGVERDQDAQAQHADRKQADSRDDPDALDQYPRQGRAQRLEAEGQQAEAAVHPALELVGDERQAIAEL